jgi:hypothetical protein
MASSCHPLAWSWPWPITCWRDKTIVVMSPAGHVDPHAHSSMHVWCARTFHCKMSPHATGCATRSHGDVQVVGATIAVVDPALPTWIVTHVSYSEPFNVTKGVKQEGCVTWDGLDENFWCVSLFFACMHACFRGSVTGVVGCLAGIVGCFPAP